MEIQNVGEIKKVMQTSASNNGKSEAVEHDNKYAGETVTSETLKMDPRARIAETAIKIAQMKPNDYQTKIAAASIPTDADGKLQTDYTGWVEVPSYTNDPENYHANLKKLQALLNRNGTKDYFALAPCLKYEDYQVYLENGQHKLCLLRCGDRIKWIEDELHNFKIPQKYIETLKQHIKYEDLKLGSLAKQEMEKAEIEKAEIEKIKNELGEDAIKNADARKILPYFGIDVKENENGLLTISEYRQLSKEYTCEDLGIDENKLFKNIESIEGNADFRNTQVTDLGQLKFIGGNAKLSYSDVTNLGQLQSIGGNAKFIDAKVTDLGQLQFIGGDANFSGSQVTNLGQLQSIGGYAAFSMTEVENLGQLKFIGGSVVIKGSKLTKDDFKNINVNGNIITTDEELENFRTELANRR